MEITDKLIGVALEAYDSKGGYSKIEKMRAALEAVLSMNAEPVAWMDDGTTRNGSETTSYRVVSAETKAAMPKASSDNFNTPLYAALPAQLKGVTGLVEVVEAMARFDGRNNNSHLKQMAKDALAAYGAAPATKQGVKK